MKFLNLLTFCWAVTSNPIHSDPSRTLGGVIHPGPFFNSTPGHTPTPRPSPLNELLPRKVEDPYKAYRAARDAAGFSLEVGKSYYFMTCNVLDRGWRFESYETAQIWVQKETKNMTPKLPYGCGHVGLVVGEVQQGDPGCGLCKPRKKLVAKYMHVTLDLPGKWRARTHDYDVFKKQRLVYQGETAAVDTKVQKALDEATRKWVWYGGDRFDETKNCLTYYRNLTQVL